MKTRWIQRTDLIETMEKIFDPIPIILVDANMKEIIRKNKLLESKLKHYEKVLSQINTTRYTWDHICGQSLSIRQTVRMGKKVSQTVSNVLLTGESGTGKELFAHAIHHGSQRKSSPFIKINCAAIPGQLIESELFGYEEGAFTGARRDGKKGKFELAHKGSIFLDEIGDLPLDMQAKLLRVLQEKEFERIGGNRTIQVDVRVIAATNRNLEEMCRTGLFRSDLFFRLNVMSIQIPSLKERMDDLPVLIEVLLDKLARRLDKKRIHISQDALAALGGYHWPGNIRELENMLERAMILADRDIITREHLALPRVLSDRPLVPSAGSLKTIVETVEKNAIAACLKQVNGNRSEAARILAISRSALYDRLKKFNL